MNPTSSASSNSAPSDKIQQIEAMRMGVSYRGTLRLRDFTVRVRPISNMEETEIISSVVERMKASPEHYRNRQTEQLLYARLLLEKASTSDVGANDPQLTEYILARMTNGELLCLLKDYNAFCDAVNPQLDEMSKDEIMRLVDEVKKSPDLATSYSRLEMLNVIRFLVATKDG